MDAALDHAEFTRCLDRLRLGVGASELHGSLSGYLCAGGTAHSESWLRELALEEAAETVAGSGERGLFVRLFESVDAALADPQLGFGLLLPDDEAPIAERAAALVDWCRGFLGGVGLAGAGLPAGDEGDLGEVLHDFSRIASTEVDGGEVDEDEEAYAEVVEYVRVGALLVRTEFARAPDAATRH
jgi:uncharacterized protein YgfB (UPF0149 family)